MHALQVVAGSYAADDAPGIYGFDFDPINGTLTQRGSFTGIANPSFVVLHPNHRYLYAVSETNAQDGAPGTVWACRLQHDPWTLQPLGNQPSGGDAPCHLALDRAGRWLLVSNYTSGSVGVLPVLDDGSLGPLSDLVQHTGSGPHAERQNGPHAHSANWSPDERFVIVADLGIDALVVYAFDHQTGTLDERHRVATHAGAGPRHAAFHPNGHYLYVANELDSTVTCYAFDAATGKLWAQQTLSSVLPNSPPNTAADIHLDAAGQRLYVSNRGDNSLAFFAVAFNGKLSLETVRPCGGATPRNFALAPNGHWALIANQDSDGLVALALNEHAQPTGEPQHDTTLSRPTCVQIVGAD